MAGGRRRERSERPKEDEDEEDVDVRSPKGPKRNYTFDDEKFGLDETEIENAYRYSDRVLTTLKELGLNTGAQRPKLEKEHNNIFRGLEEGSYFDGRLPTVIKNLNFDEISALYSLFSGWYRYIAALLNEVNVKRSEANHQQEALWSFVRMKHLKGVQKMGFNLTDQRCSDLARYDERFVLANAQYAELTALRDCYEGLRKVAEKDMEVISREVSIRQGQTRADERGQSIGSGSRFDVDRYRRSSEALRDTRRAANAGHREEEGDEEDEKPRRVAKPTAKVVFKRSFLNKKKAPTKAKSE